MEINGFEANALLFAVDKWCETDLTGQVTKAMPTLTLAESKRLRDRLFSAHEHRYDHGYTNFVSMDVQHPTRYEYNGPQCSACGAPLDSENGSGVCEGVCEE